tara:strand:+ start:228 stop:533 length:306 start_codon:yes stop_codon:yes gene_type:complete
MWLINPTRVRTAAVRKKRRKEGLMPTYETGNIQQPIKRFEYDGYHPTIEFAQSLGWEKDPDCDDDYLDPQGYLDVDKALDEAFKFIRSRGWKIGWQLGEEG